MCLGILQEDENAPDREQVTFSTGLGYIVQTTFEIATTVVGRFCNIISELLLRTCLEVYPQLFLGY